jgi:hypothetical protein
MFNSDVCLTASICLETLVIDSDPGPVPGGSCCQCQLKFHVEAHSVTVAVAINFNLLASIVLEPLVIDPVCHVVNSTSLS